MILATRGWETVVDAKDIAHVMFSLIRFWFRHLKTTGQFSGYDLESQGFWLLKSQLPSAQNNASLGIRKTNLANLLYGGFLLAATGL